jgi:hypothetical protein
LLSAARQSAASAAATAASTDSGDSDRRNLDRWRRGRHRPGLLRRRRLNRRRRLYRSRWRLLCRDRAVRRIRGGRVAARGSLRVVVRARMLDAARITARVLTGVVLRNVAGAEITGCLVGRFRRAEDAATHRGEERNAPHEYVPHVAGSRLTCSGAAVQVLRSTREQDHGREGPSAPPWTRACHFEESRVLMAASGSVISGSGRIPTASYGLHSDSPQRGKSSSYSNDMCDASGDAAAAACDC